MSMLSADKLSLGYDGAAIVTDLDLVLPRGKVTALVGPNGCGKSTLLRGLARLLTPRSGAVYLDGDRIARLPSKELARRLGILPQAPGAPEGLLVRDLVAQGRYPHQRWFQQRSLEDDRITERAMTITGILDLADRPLDALSGGQRQRAWIAMALAQDTPTLLLDEPTTYLDVAHQLEVLHLLQRLNAEDGRTIVMVLHDLNQAARYADHMVAMQRGRVIAAGTPHEVMTAEMLRDVFGIEADIVPDPRTGAPLCIPYGLRDSIASAEPKPPLERVAQGARYVYA